MLGFREKVHLLERHRPVTHDAHEQITQFRGDRPLKRSPEDLCCWVTIEASSIRQCYVAQDGNKAQGVRRRQRMGGPKTGRAMRKMLQVYKSIIIISRAVCMLSLLSRLNFNLHKS